ncbi:uncharacterized protein METZ01_LOCUS249474, partial [marine metagenome]
MQEFDYRPFDREIWAKELEDFVPKVIFDMHTHMWSEQHKGSLSDPPTGLRAEFDYQAHLEWAKDLYPGREMHFLVLGTPIWGGIDIEGHNDWMAEQIASDPFSV